MKNKIEKTILFTITVIAMAFLSTYAKKPQTRRPRRLKMPTLANAWKNYF